MKKIFLFKKKRSPPRLIQKKVNLIQKVSWCEIDTKSIVLLLLVECIYSMIDTFCIF